MLSTLPTRDELELIRDFVLLPLMLTYVQEKIDEMELEPYSLKRLYIAALRKLQDAITKDLTNVRKQMRQRYIKVWKLDREDSALHYRYRVRGYEDEFGMMRFVVKSEISVRLGKYVAGVFKS